MIMTSTGEEYRSRMDPNAYLKYYDNLSEWHTLPLRELHTLFQSYLSGEPIKVLEFGAGPTLAYTVSAAAVAGEIVLAEFAEQNREALRKWLSKASDAYDWTPYFTHVVQELEGKSEQEATKRQERLREVVKAVVTCDIKDNPPIQSGYEGPYDVIYSSLCLDACCATPQEFIDAVCKLTSLLKPGGKIAINSVCGDGPTLFYMIGDEKFVTMNSTPDLLTTALVKAGCSEISIKIQHREELALNFPEDSCDFTTMFFTVGTKKIN